MESSILAETSAGFGGWHADTGLGAIDDVDRATRVDQTVGLEAYNILNRTNFTTYVGTVDSPLFGRAIAAQPPRRVQLSLRAKF
jgi:hypothetical protein